MRQGMAHGMQYRSTIYTYTALQLHLARRSEEAYQQVAPSLQIQSKCPYLHPLDQWTDQSELRDDLASHWPIERKIK